MSPFSAFRLAAASLLLVAAAPAAGHAQHRSQAEEEQEVRAVVGRLFDAMRVADSATLRTLFHPEARLFSAGRRNGQPMLRSEPVDDFLRAVAAPRKEVLDERIWDVEARVDGDLATAWMQYAFYLGEQFSHCGVNAFQLFRGADGWQVIQIADTRRREPCQQPPR